MITRQDVWQFVRLARPQNLLLAWVTFALAGFLSYYRSTDLFADPLFWAEGALIVLIMAGGYWINDVYDFRIDRINRPARAIVGGHLSTKKVISFYIALTIGCAVASLFLPLKYLLINTAALGGLLLYAHLLKRTAGIGNVVIAALAGAVVLAGALLHALRLPLMWMMGFAFLTTLVREVVKDAEDLRGDMRYGLQTLPVVVGLRATKNVVLALYLLLGLLTVTPFATETLLGRAAPWGYLVVVILGVGVPLVVIGARLQAAVRPTDFGWQSTRLKWLMVAGLAALFVLAWETKGQ